MGGELVECLLTPAPVPHKIATYNDSGTAYTTPTVNVNAKVSGYRLVNRIEYVDYFPARPRNVVVWKRSALMGDLCTPQARFSLENLGVRLKSIAFLGEIEKEGDAVLK